MRIASRVAGISVCPLALPFYSQMNGCITNKDIVQIMESDFQN